MNKEEIIKEYKNYCSDLNIDHEKESSKKRFLYDLLVYLYNKGELSCYNNNFEEYKNSIKKILEDMEL